MKWAFLADPGAYGWSDLERDGRAVWDGIANASAQRNLGKCAVGDEVLLYHTAPDKAVIGVARVTRAAYPDPADARRVVVDVEPVRRFPQPVPLARLKSDDVLREMGFVRMPRVAVQPVTAAQWTRLEQVAHAG